MENDPSDNESLFGDSKMSDPDPFISDSRIRDSETWLSTAVARDRRGATSAAEIVERGHATLPLDRGRTLPTENTREGAATSGSSLVPTIEITNTGSNVSKESSSKKPKRPYRKRSTSHSQSTTEAALSKALQAIAGLETRCQSLHSRLDQQDQRYDTLRPNMFGTEIRSERASRSCKIGLTSRMR